MASDVTRRPRAQPTGAQPQPTRSQQRAQPRRRPQRSQSSDAELWIEGRHPVIEALKSPARVLQIVAASPDKEIAQLAHDRGIVFKRVNKEEFDQRARSSVPQGVMALVEMPKPATLKEIASTSLVIALDGITDPQNLGAIARSAEAFGGAMLVAQDRSAPLSAVAVKASAGALLWLKVARVVNLERALQELKELGMWIVTLEGEADQDLKDSPLLAESICLVVGAEGKGVSRLVSERADARVKITLRGRVESLNASVAAGIALRSVTEYKHAEPVRSTH